MSQKVLDLLKNEFGDAIVATSAQFGDDTAIVEPARWQEIATFLRDNRKCAFDHFIDLTAVDYKGRRTPRYEVVLHLRSINKLHRIRLKACIDSGVDEAGDKTEPAIGTLCDVWRGANWFERECYDMFGINFVGHPDLRRILMYEEFVGYPLRKDYPAQKTQPLIPYRDGVNNVKLPPFGDHEGLPFGRQTHHVGNGSEGTGVNQLGFEEDN